MDEFAPYIKRNGSFVVQNICNPNKVIKIFNYPILYNDTRDLLKIPGVSESDIRASLLKGEIRNKLLAGEITVIASDIDLLQFNDAQKKFLQSAGIINGLQITSYNLNVNRKEDVQLLGSVNDINTVFTCPDGIFIQNATYKIIVYRNGVKQFLGDDYFVAESGGIGTGYNTVIFNTAPTTTPAPLDVITADYYIANI